MRKNEYTSLEEFTSQYVGEWGPSDGHWFGLDCIKERNIDCIHGICMLMKRMRFSDCITGKKRLARVSISTSCWASMTAWTSFLKAG